MNYFKYLNLGEEYYDVENGKNLSNLKFFKINGLFNRYDVSLNFEKQVNIFVGENGLGKTTILNCLYYVLKKKYKKLERISFESIEILFKSDPRLYKIHKNDIIVYNEKNNKQNQIILNYLNKKYDYNELDELQDILRFSAKDHDFISVYEIVEKRNKSIEKGNKKNVHSLNKAINNNIKEQIIYLPTYRRIETNFSNFNINTEKSYELEDSIRFGMSDVQKTIDDNLDEIRRLAVEGFNKMTGLLIEQYVKKNDTDIFIDTSSKFFDENEKYIVKLMLDRLGDEVDSSVKERIGELIESYEVHGYKYVQLKNLLVKFIETYDEQKKYDDKIIAFAKVCNKYLIDKKFRYNQNELTLKIYIDNPNHYELDFDNDKLEQQDIIELNQLSSGEKQIVSLFSQLYLGEDDEKIVIIDEPELSLSIVWQRMLLPDIVRSKKCNFLFTVTHSPFVFDNEFDMDTEEIRKYIKRSDEVL